jgi:toxin CcdB
VPQWDVYANANPRTRTDVPFLVDVQSDLLSGLRTRFVVPLVAPTRRLPGLPERMSPTFEIAGQRVLLVPHEAGPVDAGQLRRPVSNLRDQAHRLIDAIDTVIRGV